MREAETTAKPIDDLAIICEEIFERWDAGMQPGKLLRALGGDLPNYDPRVERIRSALERARQP